MAAEAGPSSQAQTFKCCGGEWVVEEKLGAGAFATVYRCRDTGVSRLGYCAAKVSVLDALTHQAKERAFSEVRLWQSLGSHPHIVSCLGPYHPQHFVVLLLELCTGGDLLTRIGSFEVRESDAARWISQLLVAVDFLHTMHGVIHRDLKPDNMLLASDARDAPLKIADFGTAKQLVDPGTGTRTPCGSLGYAAPEQMLYLRGKAAVTYGHAADVWAVGITAYAILSGTLPFSPRSVGWVRTVPDRIEQGAGVAPLELEFPPATFGATSALARTFVTELLQLDPARRPSAAAACHHAWLAVSLSHTPSPLSSSAGGSATNVPLMSAPPAGGKAHAPHAHAHHAPPHLPPHMPPTVPTAPASAHTRSAPSEPGSTPPSDAPLMTPEQLRGLLPHQFAAEWDQAARLSASWLQRKQSPGVRAAAYPASSRAAAPSAAELAAVSDAWSGRRAGRGERGAPTQHAPSQHVDAPPTLVTSLAEPGLPTRRDAAHPPPPSSHDGSLHATSSATASASLERAAPPFRRRASVVAIKRERDDVGSGESSVGSDGGRTRTSSHTSLLSTALMPSPCLSAQQHAMPPLPSPLHELPPLDVGGGSTHRLALVGQSAPTSDSSIPTVPAVGEE
jgi:calcium/calmodulin-dependent protein kinase I